MINMYSAGTQPSVLAEPVTTVNYSFSVVLPKHWNSFSK